MAPDARRTELIEAAERLLRQRGAAATRVEDIVQAADAAKGTFYLYFASWDDLLGAIRERIFADFDAQFGLRQMPATAAEWWQLVDDLAVSFVDFVLGLEGLHDAIFHGSLANSRPLAPGNDAASRIRLMIEMGAKAGVFAAVDAEPHARFLFAVLHEAVDGIAGGADRARTLSALKLVLRRALGQRDC